MDYTNYKEVRAKLEGDSATVSEATNDKEIVINFKQFDVDNLDDKGLPTKLPDFTHVIQKDTLIADQKYLLEILTETQNKLNDIDFLLGKLK